MATRAAIIYFDGDNGQFTSTYNHYDGYPENLGVALEKHYNDDFKAHKISREGYISYMDPETGEIDQKNQQDPDVEQIYDEDTAASQINDIIQSYGADYAYIFSTGLDKWVTIKNDGAKTTMNTLDQLMPEMFGRGDMGDKDLMEDKNYMTEWKAFLNEVNEVDKVMSQAFFKLQDEPKEMISAYKASLANDIRLNGKEQYADFSVEDFIEDYNEYVNDKMDF
jgi:hypothetical protein